MARDSVSGVYYEICGVGEPLFLGFPIMASHAEIFGRESGAVRDAYLEQLTDSYRVLLVDYPSIGRSADIPTDALTPDRVCHDFLSVADAAGFDRFAYWAYSWGGAAGLQLAARTDRLTALAVGGWPPLGAQYDAMLRASLEQMEDPPPEVQVVLRSPAQYAQWSTFYGSIRNWPERDVARDIACPKLAFVGAEGDTDAGSEAILNATIIRTRKAELESLGWQVSILDGVGHEVCMKPDVLVPAIRPFLDAAVKSS